MNESEIRKVVKETIRELKRDGLLKDVKTVAYQTTAERLSRHYAGAEDEELEIALDELRADYYFRVLPLYYGKRMTIEQIAEQMNVEVSTIVRNKRRLCLMLYGLLE